MSNYIWSGGSSTFTPNSGNWQTSGSWRLGTVNGNYYPQGYNDDAVIFLPGTYTVTSTGNNNANTISLNNPNATLQQIGGSLGTSYLNNSSGTVVIDGGAAGDGSLYVVALSGVVDLRNNATLHYGATSDSTKSPYGTIQFDDNTSKIAMDTSTGNLDATISGFRAGDQIVNTFNNGSISGFNSLTNQLTVLGGGRTLTYNFTPGYKASDFVLTNSSGKSTVTTTLANPPCYLRGTRLRTTRGEVRVERLRVGDTLVGALDGAALPVSWIGRKAVALPRDPAALAAATQAVPVRVCAGALAPNVPTRDLLVSPGHHLFLDGHLVPARQLVNGTTITQQAPRAPDNTPLRRLEYFHVEVAPAQAILLAEGAPAESWLDTGNRAQFDAPPTPGLRPLPTATVPDAPADAPGACAPTADAATLAAIARRLLTRAAALGATLTTDPDPHLLVDGARLDPVRVGQLLTFLLPPGAREVRLASHTAAPAWTAPETLAAATLAAAEDPRGPAAEALRTPVGLRVQALAIDDLPLSLDDPRLYRQGWHPTATPDLTGRPTRWTGGPAAIPATGARRVSVWLHPEGIAYPAMPTPAVAQAA